MIAYFDTSALIPLLIEEPASVVAGRLWDAAARAVSVRLVYPEARAVLARAARLGRISPAGSRAAVSGLEELDRQLYHIEVTALLAARAGHIAEALALRGYDAVHLAAAESVADGELVVVTGDLALGSAADALGMARALL